MYVNSMKVNEKTYNELLEKFANNTEVVKEHFDYVRDNLKYDCLYTRVGWDILRHVTDNGYIARVLYDQELNDKHISSMVKRLVKQVLDS